MGRFGVVLKIAWDEYSGKQSISGSVWRPRQRWLGMIKGVTRMRLSLKEQVLKFSQWDGACGWNLGRDVSLKAIIDVHGFWSDRAAEDGYLVLGFYG